MRQIFLISFFVVVSSLIIPRVCAEDRAMADALASAGAAHASKGNTEQARDLLFKALANDDKCPDALYELARIYEKENKLVDAGEFYRRAANQMALENKPASAAKRADADKRVKLLNPFLTRLTGVYDDYARELDRLTTRLTDPATQEAAGDRVEQLKLSTVLPPEKMPKFYAGLKRKGGEVAAVGNSGTSPEVEKELKALGWTKITGTWEKKGPGAYLTTDGKLEAQKVNGSIDLQVWKGFTGTVKACVRNGFASENFFDLNLSGYGVSFKGKECRIFGPNVALSKFLNGSLDSVLIRADQLPDSSPKHHAMVMVQEGSLEYNVNEKRHSVSNNKLPRNGPFVIEVTGTAIIEAPRCSGQ